MGTTPRSIQSLLHSATQDVTPDVTNLLGRVHFLGRIRDALLAVLPDQAAPHVHVAGYEDYRLCVHVTNASWATRLRYMQPAIARALAQRMRLQIDHVDIRVRPPSSPAAPPVRARRISAANRAHIRRVAAYVTDAPLANALQRLAAAGTPASAKNA